MSANQIAFVPTEEQIKSAEDVKIVLGDVVSGKQVYENLAVNVRRFKEKRREYASVITILYLLTII